jgi:hypothetical protein
MPISKINTSSITDNSVTAGKIVAGAVDADIAAGSIDTAQIADDAVTADKLANAINTSIAVGSTANTTANAALPKAGGTMTGALDVNAAATLGGGTDEIQIIGGGGTARVDAIGGNTNVNLSLSTKGTGKVYFWRGGYGGTQMALLDSDGLKFGADTAAANALDDYEEGTWTPALTDGKTGSGNYVKIGRLVTVNFLFANIGGSGSTAQRVTALPFTSYTQNGGSYSEIYRVEFPSNAVDFILFTYAGSTTLGMTFQVSDGVPIALTGSHVDHSSATLNGTITYQTS